MAIREARRFFFGRELETEEAPHQTIGKAVGLAVFASDSLSSVAYAGGEILLVLAVLGSAHYWLAIPITVAISVLLIVLTFSYRQTIYAYPSGGGAYIVARDNLGEVPAQVAGAALLTDYVLTVAVSIAAGVDQIASAFPALFDYKVQIALLMILLITFVNLRGVKESGRVFALPTYFFIAMMVLLIGTGSWQAASGQLGTVGDVPGALEGSASLTGLAFTMLMLRAFSSGTTAVTGVEAISNGITAFREPRSKNAADTLLWDAALLMTMFLGLGILAFLVGAQPSDQEVLISQVARTVYGAGALRLLTLASATVILLMAANTSFADFPRLAALVAGDGFLPKQFTFRSSRLVFNWGVILLAAFSCLLVVIFAGSVSRLIPLYAIGVFLSFTLSQAGMVRRWQKVGTLMRAGRLPRGAKIATLGSVLEHDRGWPAKLLLNAVGATLTAVVAAVFLVSKFTHGAWITAVIIPGLLWLFFRIHRHYRAAAKALSTSGLTVSRRRRHVMTIVLVGDVHRESMRLVEFAIALGVPWKAVHVAVQPESVPEIRRKWAERIGIGELVVVPSPYRSLTQPLRQYVRQALVEHPEGFVHVVLGHLRTSSPLTQLLHQNAHLIEQLALGDIDGVVTTVVPFQLDVDGPAEETGDERSDGRAEAH